MVTYRSRDVRAHDDLAKDAASERPAQVVSPNDYLVGLVH